jgi:hypothetical protein
MQSGNNNDSKIDSNIPFRVLPQEIQDYLILQKTILEKDWDSCSREKQQNILNEYALQKTVNQVQVIEQKSATNNKEPVKISRENVQLLKKNPDVVWNMIGEFLGSNPKVNSGKTKPDLNAMKSMAEVSKASYFLFQPAMNKAKKAKLNSASIYFF